MYDKTPHATPEPAGLTSLRDGRAVAGGQPASWHILLARLSAIACMVFLLDGRASDGGSTTGTAGKRNYSCYGKTLGTLKSYE